MADIKQGTSRMGIPPYIREILDLIEKPDSNTGLDISGNLILGGDDRYIAFGAAGVTDSSIYFDGSDLTFKDSTTGTKTLAQLSAAASETLDQAFDLGKTIDGANSSGNAFKVGDGTNSISFYGDATDLYIATSGGDLKFSAAGGDVTFDNDNISTTGTISNGTITLNGGAVTGAASLASIETITSTGALAIKTSGDADDFLEILTSGNVPIIGTNGACDLKITASSGEIDFDNENLTTTGTLDAGLVTCAGIVNTTTAIDTTAAIQIGADNVKLSLGTDDSTDSYIQFNGTHLQFYDSNLGSAVTLTDLAGGALSGPTVTGDMTISDGRIIWTDATDEVAGTFTFANTTNDGIDVVANSATTGNIIHVQSTSLTSGTGIRVDTAEGTLNAGYYFEAYDTTGSATVFSVGEDGAVVIAGAAADVLTLTAGNIQMTDGNIDMDEGKIEVNTTTDETSYIKKNAAGSAAVVEIENTEVTSTGSALLIDQNATGNAIALEITHDGDYAAIDVSAGAARTGDVIHVAMANQLAQKAINIDGAAVAAGNQGVIDVRTTGALAGSLVYLHQGTGAPTAAEHILEIVSSGDIAAANATGACLKITETGAAQATSYAAYISSTNNEALHVDAGAVLVDETVTANGGFITTIADTSNVDAITVAQNDTTNDKDGIAVTMASAGSGVKVTQTDVTGKCLNLVGAANHTAALALIDGTTGDWLGADGVGMLELTNDGTHAHADTSMLKVEFSGTSASGEKGVCLRIDDSGTSGGGTEYSVYINSANHEAIKVDAGAVVVDETLTASGGLISKHSTADITHAAPTALELAGAFGFTTAGQMGTIDDAGGAANAFFVFYDGTNYWYSAFTKAS